ncbi:MAG: hypothetical protein R3F14_29795 [Polyangiaceae bacterium]
MRSLAQEMTCFTCGSGTAGRRRRRGSGRRTGAVVAGVFAGTVNFGGGAIASGGGNDGFVASYDYLGAHLWSKGFGDGAAQAVTGSLWRRTGMWWWSATTRGR